MNKKQRILGENRWGKQNPHGCGFLRKRAGVCVVLSLILANEIVFGRNLCYTCAAVPLSAAIPVGGR